jgi:hypothetical protein
VQSDTWCSIRIIGCISSGSIGNRDLARAAGKLARQTDAITTCIDGRITCSCYDSRGIAKRPETRSGHHLYPSPNCPPPSLDSGRLHENIIHHAPRLSVRPLGSESSFERNSRFTTRQDIPTSAFVNLLIPFSLGLVFNSRPTAGRREGSGICADTSLLSNRPFQFPFN